MSSFDYLVFIEPTETGFVATCPDLPGCRAEGVTLDETQRNIHRAMKEYVDALRRAGKRVPESRRSSS